MTENLTQLVREFADKPVIKNSAIADEHNNAAIEHIALTIVDSLKCQVIGGGLKEVMSLFSGKIETKSHPVVAEVGNCVVNDLISKFGIGHIEAVSISSQLIPNVMERFVKKTINPTDFSFDMNNVISIIGGAAVRKNRSEIFKSGVTV